MIKTYLNRTIKTEEKSNPKEADIISKSEELNEVFWIICVPDKRYIPLLYISVERTEEREREREREREKEISTQYIK